MEPQPTSASAGSSHRIDGFPELSLRGRQFGDCLERIRNHRTEISREDIREISDGMGIGGDALHVPNNIQHELVLGRGRWDRVPDDIPIVMPGLVLGGNPAQRDTRENMKQ